MALAIGSLWVSGMNSSYSWFALQARPKCEWVAREGLALKGYECFLPSYRQKKRWADRVVEKELPLFPSYLFCRFDLQAPAGMGRVVSTPGVWRIVSFGGKPVSIADHEIEGLQKLMNGELPREPLNYVPTGTRVRIVTGPLAGVEGISLPNSNHRKLVLSVSLLRRSVVVSLEHNTAVTILEAPSAPEEIRKRLQLQQAS